MFIINNLIFHSIRNKHLHKNVVLFLRLNMMNDRIWFNILDNAPYCLDFKSITKKQV